MNQVEVCISSEIHFVLSLHTSVARSASPPNFKIKYDECTPNSFIGDDANKLFTLMSLLETGSTTKYIHAYNFLPSNL
jgi:hypothetical protein